MGKDKLFRFAEISKMAHVIEPTMDMILSGNDFKGKWRELFFKNKNPIILELGCGKGEYALELAKRNPDFNFVGVDIKGDRIYIGAKQSEEEKLKNIFFLRTKIDFIDCFFSENEVSEIWLTFSDPQPKKPKKRLTSKYFIEKYRKILAADGIIHLKTDSDTLFASTEEQIQINQYQNLFLSWDIYNDFHLLPKQEQAVLSVKTYYEELFTKKGACIKYCKFTI